MLTCFRLGAARVGFVLVGGSTGVDRVSDAVGALDAAIRERMIGRRGWGRSMVKFGLVGVLAATLRHGCWGGGVDLRGGHVRCRGCGQGSQTYLGPRATVPSPAT